MLKPVFSIIVPVYNVEQYLSRCIDSILKQTFNNFELLLINDGSLDDSGNICDEYARKDSRIRVFHKKNGGVSSARNLELKESCGEWIYFIDSDDYIQPYLFETASKYLLMSDIIHFGYLMRKDNVIIKKNKPKKIEVYTEMKKFYWRGYYYPALWSYIFKKEFLVKNDINCPLGVKYSEDQCFIIKALMMSPNIQNISGYYYNYMLRDGSAITNYSENQANDQLNVLDELFNYIGLKNVSMSYFPTTILFTFVENFFYFSVKSLNNKCGTKELFIQKLEQLKNNKLFAELFDLRKLKYHTFEEKELKVYKIIRFAQNLHFRINRFLNL